MATEQKAATEDVKMDLFEDDDEFEEFEINEELVKKEVGSAARVLRDKYMLRPKHDTGHYNECLYYNVMRIAEWEDKEEGKEATQQWEDDWDDDDVNDDFSLQLRRELEKNCSRELEKNTEKN